MQHPTQRALPRSFARQPPRAGFLRVGALALGLWAAAAIAQPASPPRSATPEEQALDAIAFAGLDQRIGERLPDVQSVVVLLQGRVAYQYHRDGNPETLRDTQSVSKSALVALVGAALRQGQVASLDQPVVDLVAEWRQRNPGETFAYDNSIINLVVAVLEKATGGALADYAREQVVGPLDPLFEAVQKRMAAGGR